MLDYVGKKNIHTLTEGTFALGPHSLESLFQGVLVIPPSLKPMNFIYFFSSFLLQRKSTQQTANKKSSMIIFALEHRSRVK